MPSVLVFGSTGLVGNATIKAIKRAHPFWQVTAFVRSGKPVDDIRSELGVERVVDGEFSEADKIKNLSQEHEIVVNAGQSSSGELASAIVEGLKQRTTEGKLIHISGGGNFIDFGTSGEFNPKSKVWSDDNEDDIKQIKKEMFNGASDTAILQAGKDDLVETYIICPGIIYGTAAVGTSNLGLGYASIVTSAKELGYTTYVAGGSSIVSCAHVTDVVDFIVKIVDLAAAGPPADSVYQRYYIVENSAVSWKELSTELAKALYSKGVIPKPEARSMSFDDAGLGPFKFVLGANMLMKGPRAVKMGFRAAHPGILEQVHEDIRAMEV